MFVISLIVVSVLLQIATAFMALRLIKATGNQWAWIFIAMAMVLQVFRRILILNGLITGEFTDSQVQTSELVGLILSAFMFIGVKNIEPFFVAQARSIAERKQTEEGLRKTVKKLKELDELKDNFLSLTTHELKTPLVPIKSQIQLLLADDYGELNKEQREALEMISRNEQSLDKLASDILDIAKIKSNKLSLLLEEISLGEVIGEAVKNMEKAAQEKHTILSFLSAPEASKILISADKRRIGQVLGNLLQNAIKFTPEKGEIKIKVYKKENDIIVTVEDTGIGLSKDNIKKLFTPFFQVKNKLVKKDYGTGLGLAISEGIVEVHGGKIWAESEGEGKGSRFSFSLPIKIK